MGKIMLEEKRLESHKLISTALENLRPVIKAIESEWSELVKKSGKLPPKLPKKSGKGVPEPYFYYWQVFYYAMRLVDAIRTIRDIQTFLRKFPQPRTYEKHGITPDRWIEYHYSNYVTIVVSLYDIALILTNAVFRLGIPERQCKDDVVTNNAWVTGTPVKSALEHLNKVIQPFRMPRHGHIHRGEVPDIEELEKTEHFDELKLFSVAQLFAIPEAASLRDLADFLYSHESVAIRLNLEAKRKLLERALLALFDALLPIYEAQTSKLKTTG